jgi:hypothetical protein
VGAFVAAPADSCYDAGTRISRKNFPV